MKRGGGVPPGGPVADGQLVAVAVDDDKNSQHALKWAADHLIARTQIFILLHIRNKKPSANPSRDYHPLGVEEEEEEEAAASENIDLQTKELLLPFQCFCSRKGLQCKEIIMDDVDIAKAIINFVALHSVDKLVLGASSRSALTRTFMSDIPSSVSKSAPDFCSVYVISKGKISSIRPAPLPNSHSARRSALSFETPGSQFLSTKSEPDVRHHIEASGRSSSSHSSDSDRTSQLGERVQFSYQSIASCPSPSRTSIDRRQNYYSRESLDGGGQPAYVPHMRGEHALRHDQLKGFESNRTSAAYTSSSYGFSGYEHSVSDDDGRTSWSNQSMEDMELEMRRLQLELKQRRDMYEDAAKEANSYNLGEDMRFKGAGLAKYEVEEKQKNKFLHEAPQEKMRNDLREENSLVPKLIDSKSTLDALSTHVRYRRYSIEEIQKATDNFSNALKIGEGGYGPVFKSTLDHTLVAIKTLRSDAAQGMKQFQQEVEVLSCIRHPNMVLLMGACPEYGCLVYEYMANGSLEDRLLCNSNTPPLSWQLRFKIAAEVATGLLFLHQTKPEPLVHRDLKPGNILLDHNFVSKIADVGLARLIPPSVAADVTMYHMTAAAGTFCYIDPEYQKTGMLGTKSDIYALGIILLQLITASPPMGLAHVIENAMETGTLKQMLDRKVTDWPMEETMRFAKLALKCAELRRKDRPDLGSVVLPELNRLREFAISRLDGPWSYHGKP